MRPLFVFLLTTTSLLASPAENLRPDPAACWQFVQAARQIVASAAPDKIPAVRARQWKEIAEAHPVIIDWLLQDLGAEALQIADPFSTIAPAELFAKAAARFHSPALAPGVDPAQSLASYVHLASERRHQRLGASLPNWGSIAFTESHTYRMSFIGYTEGLSDARNERFFEPGSRLCLLEFPQGSLFASKRVLVDDPLGMMRDVDVSPDGRRILFAWKKSNRLDDYHLHEWNLSNDSWRQLTAGLGRADYEPLYLPDGDILFTSTRPEQSVPCWWTEISNLYRMNADGQYMRRLAIDQVHALYPQLLADGRVTYTRWDYNDRGQNFPHPVFSMLPDGRDQRAFYGGNSWFPTSLLHTRGIPGSHKAMSIAAGHHTTQKGKLVLLDNREGRDEGKGMHFIAPRREMPYERVDAAMQSGDQFRYPYPFSENEFLISYRPAAGVERFGLYWMNADGDRELLWNDPSLDAARMVPTGHRPLPSVVKDEVDYRQKTGIYFVKDVYEGVGLQGIARGAAKTIRVVRLDYRAAGVGMTSNRGEGGGSLNSSPVSVGNGSWDVKVILGDAEIEADGSARFEVPAMESIFLQILDEKGRVIQTSRTWDTLRPGETKGCVGCHDKTNGNFHPYQKDQTLAWRRDVQKLRHFHGAPQGFSFPKQIQPILDAKCISCHDGSHPPAMDLRSTPVDDATLNARKWSRSYLNLTGAKRSEKGGYSVDKPEAGMVNWISKMSRPTEIPPYFAGAAKSRLMSLLDTGHHGVQLTSREYESFAAWMDLLVPFCGEYREGNAWTKSQMAYYDYYKGKRRVGEKEQQANILAYLSGKTLVSETLPGFANARFREVLREVPLVISGRTCLLLENPQVQMIDRLTLTSQAPAHAVVRILHRRTRECLASGKLSAQSSLSLVLSKPIRSDAIELTTDSPICPPMTLASASGVSLAEVPLINGFHPFLDVSPVQSSENQFPAESRRSGDLLPARR